ncbi:NAD(P)-binding protein, partial [Lepidopterella palustris CBS 459.81]
SLPPSNGKTVLVTGINGYIASMTGLLLLEKGYTVRGTSRSLISSKPLLDGSYRKYVERLELVEIPDMTISGAFDAAVYGVSGIIHSASPVNFALSDPNEVIVPAIEGATGILKSALKHGGSQLESFVLTSSGAAIIGPKPNPEYIFTESDWNDFAEDEVKRLGNEASGNLVYNASKAAAEKAVWEFRDSVKPSFAISSVNPGVVIGPSVQAFPTGFKPNVSLEQIWNIFTGNIKDIPPRIGSGSFVHVRDTAGLHVWALENPIKSNGERYLAIAGPGFPQMIADILHKAYPNRADIMPRGRPGDGYLPNLDWPPGGISVSGKKAQEAMGITWIPLEQSVLDTAK